MDKACGPGKLETPTSRLLIVTLVLALCTSVQDGAIAMALNIPQATIAAFVNASHHGQTGTFLNGAGDTYIWTLIVVQSQLGSFLGAFLSPTVCNAVGRKRTLLLNVAPFVAGLLLQIIAKYAFLWELLLVGRFLWAMGVGASAVMIPLFITEISPRKFRGSLACVHALFAGFGTLLISVLGMPQVLGTEALWSLMFAPLVALQALQLVVLPFCPESPKQLYVRESDPAACLRSLKFYYGNVGRDVQEAALAEFDAEKRAGSQRAGFCLCAQTLKNAQLRRPLLVGMAAASMGALTGMPATASYVNEILLMNSTIAASSRWLPYASIAVAFMRFASVIASLFTVERCGRRPLFLWSAWGSAACLLVMGCLCYAFQSVAASAAGTGADAIGYSVVVVIVAHAFLATIGGQTVSGFLPSELVPTQQRPTVQAICMNVRFVVNSTLTFAFLPLFRAFNGGAFFAMLAPLLAITALMQLFMPETKSRPVPDIMAEINGKRASCRGCFGRRDCTAPATRDETASSVGHEITPL